MNSLKRLALAGNIAVLFAIFLHVFEAGGMAYIKNKILPHQPAQDWSADFHERRVSLFGSLAKPNADAIVMLGDSLTNGGEWAELLGNPHALNRGIDGDTSAGILKRVSQVAAMHPAKVFLLVGINDISHGKPAEVAANCQKVVNAIRAESTATKTYVQSVLPMRYHPSFIPTIRSVNVQLKGIQGAEFIDLYASFADERGEMKQALTNDGTHLTAAGYELWTRLLAGHL